MTQIGSIVDGRFRLLELLGKGGMSRVYLAEDIRLKKKWAVKQIPKYVNGKKNLLFIEAAVKEAKIIKNLDHPSVVRIIDISEDSRYVYIVEDYISGRPLGNIVEEQGTVSQAQLIRWAEMICNVLIYLHSRKNPVIYRDIKPDNIILTAEGLIKLVDFGAARIYKAGQKTDTCYLGTRRFAAPEQFEDGAAQTDVRTDIYGLGSMLMYLAGYCTDLSSEFERIINKAKEPAPEDRFQTVEEMKEELEKFEVRTADTESMIKVSLFRVLLVIAAFICTFLAAGALAFRAGSRQPLSEQISSAVEAASSDKVFSLEEEEKLLNIIMPCLSELKEQEGFEKTAFEIGELYWFYYDYGSDAMAGMIAAVPWFGLARGYSDLAEVYEFIGKFHEDIDRTAAGSATDGIFGLYFSKLSSLARKISAEDISITAKLEAYRLAVSSVRTYAGNFRDGGVSKSEMENLLDNTVSGMAGISVTDTRDDTGGRDAPAEGDGTEADISERDQELIKEILSGMDAAYIAVEDAYQD